MKIIKKIKGIVKNKENIFTMNNNKSLQSEIKNLQNEIIIGDIRALCDNRDVMLKALSGELIIIKRGQNLNISKRLREDKDFILEAVKNNGWALKYASEELKNDKEVVFTAVKNNGNALQFASEELKNDKGVVLTAVKNHYALGYASEKLRNDKEVVLTAVKRNGNSLQFASEELRNDKEVVFTAVKSYSYASGFASEKLKEDSEILLEASKNNRPPTTKCFAFNEISVNEYVLDKAKEVLAEKKEMLEGKSK